MTEELYMKHDENSKMYEADDGKMLVRVSDGKVIGDGICPGDNDDISNYEEREFTKEQRAQFFKDIGVEDPKKRREKTQKQQREKHGQRCCKAEWQPSSVVASFNR